MQPAYLSTTVYDRTSDRIPHRIRYSCSVLVAMMVSTSLEATILDQQTSNLRREFELFGEDMSGGVAEALHGCESVGDAQKSEESRMTLLSSRGLVADIAKFKVQLERAMQDPDFRCSEEISTPRRPEAPKAEDNKTKSLPVNAVVSE